MKIEIRNNSIVLDGYVNAVCRDSRVLPSPRGKFVEQIKANPEVPQMEYFFMDDFDTYYAEGEKLIAEGNDYFDKVEIKPDDLACIIYTSGTTGTPKGVMLMHSNFVNQIMSVVHILGKDDKRALSFLPMCHAYEKMLLYVYQYRGLSIYYAESLATIGDNIKEVNPNIMCCVPRLLEKIYNKLFAAGKKLPFAKQKL